MCVEKDFFDFFFEFLSADDRAMMCVRDEIANNTMMSMSIVVVMVMML